jgi:hypothetical protein
VTSGAADRVDVSRLDQVLVVAMLRRIADPVPADAFVVSIDIAPWDAFDEGPVLDLLARVPVQMGAQTLWSLQVQRSHVGVGRERSEARAEFRLELVAPTSDLSAGLERLVELVDSLRSLAPRSTRRLTREEAIAEARDLVALVWPVASGSPLSVSEEEHHTAPHRWTLGLVDADLARFRVVIGAVAGDPHVARLRCHAAAEVSDSIGEAG